MRSKTRRSTFALAMIGVGFLLLLIAAIWFFTSGNSQESVLATNQPDVPYPEIPRVSITDALSAHSTGTAVFLDVRAATDYAAGHITGAISIPFDQLSDRMNELNPNDWIITYCT